MPSWLEEEPHDNNPGSDSPYTIFGDENGNEEYTE